MAVHRYLLLIDTASVAGGGGGPTDPKAGRKRGFRRWRSSRTKTHTEGAATSFSTLDVTTASSVRGKKSYFFEPGKEKFTGF